MLLESVEANVSAPISADLNGARCSEPRAQLRCLVACVALFAILPSMGTYAAPPEPVTSRVVALGDSTTATTADWAPAITEVYAQCLPRTLAMHGFRADVINAGIGDTTTRAEFRNNLRYFIRRLLEDGALTILMTPNPMRWSDPFYIELFTSKPGLLDTGLGRGKSIGDLLLAGDGIHPNDAGQRLVCDLLTPGVAAALAHMARP